MSAPDRPTRVNRKAVLAFGAARRRSLAGELAGGPSRAHAVTKRQLDAEWAEPIEIALDMEAEAQAALMATNDFKRAYQAFAAKRTPEFRGD